MLDTLERTHQHLLCTPATVRLYPNRIFPIHLLKERETGRGKKEEDRERTTEWKGLTFPRRNQSSVCAALRKWTTMNSGSVSRRPGTAEPDRHSVGPLDTSVLVFVPSMSHFFQGSHKLCRLRDVSWSDSISMRESYTGRARLLDSRPTCLYRPLYLPSVSMKLWKAIDDDGSVEGRRGTIQNESGTGVEQK